MISGITLDASVYKKRGFLQDMLCSRELGFMAV